MEQSAFKFHVQNISFGWCRVLMLINDKEVWFNAEYMGNNPLSSLIDVCAELKEQGGDYHLKWFDRFIVLKIGLSLDETGMLHLDIVNQHETGREIYGEWHETIPFDTFINAIIAEGFRVLNAFGLYGYRRSWQNHTDFPLTNLLRLTGKCDEIWKGDSCCTDIAKEIEVLQEYISKLEVTEETKMDSCTLYYESWQIQCCGDPFAVGDKVEWTCISPSKYKNAHGIIIDFDEDHHGFATHAIEGVVTKIIAERSEFPKGKREVWYDKAETIREELQHANGWESDKRDDDTTERTFWGYIVELKDVMIRPLEENEKE